MCGQWYVRWGGRREEDVRIAVARRSLCDVPLEFEGEVACARAVAEASHVEGGAATARHDALRNCEVGVGVEMSRVTERKECRYLEVANGRSRILA